MEAIEKFLAMGGYAAYVWPAFGLTALVMIALLVATVRSLRARQSTLDLLKRDDSETDT